MRRVWWRRRGFTKTVLVMKLTSILILATALHVYAIGDAQEKITLSAKNESLEKVFSAVEKQTGYVFFFDEEILKNAKPVSIKAENLSIDKFLDAILLNQSLRYSFQNKTIIISRQDPNRVVYTRPSVSAEPPVEAVAAFDVRGRIMGDKGAPLAGASVSLKPLAIGTSTNESGQFVFPNVPAGNYLLEISSVGYSKISKKITVANEVVSLTFKMELAQVEEKEIVISTGYTSKKTGEITGSVQRISGDDLRKGLTTSDPTSLLKGRTTGLYISEQNAGDPTSSGGQIFLRGQSSIAGVGVDQVNEFVMPALNYGPLIVLDGVIMPNQNLKELVTAQEIQDITTLKDAAATAVYGSRAAAGVIVVTTKRGRDAKPRLSVEAKYGINQPNQGTMKFMNGQELYDYQKQYYTADYKVNEASLSQRYPTVEDYLTYKLPTQEAVANGYDWYKFTFMPSRTMEANLAASGGNDRTKYYFGGTYYNEKATGVQNSLIRGTVRMNLDTRLTDRLTLGVAINGIINNGKRDPDGNVTAYYSMIPWANPYDKNGNITQTLNYKLDGANVVTDNPLFNKQYNFLTVQSQLFSGSVRLEYRIADWLSISSTNSGNLNYLKNQKYIDVRTYSGSGTFYAPQGFLGTNTNQLSNYLTSNQLTFHKKFGDHGVRALVAMEYGQTTNDYTTTNVNQVRAGYPQISMGRQVGGEYDLSIYGIPQTKTGNIEGGKDVKALFSAFGEVGYTYRDKYTVSGSLRSDASSSFGADNRYGNFYSTGLAWIVSKENFMRNVHWVDNLKLRGSYGTTGSQLGDNFLTKTLYDPRYIYSGQGGATISVLGNPELKWEVTKILSGGIDFSIFKKLDVTIDAYNRRSEDLLQKVTLPPTYGFPTQWQNVASVQNRGIEVLMNARLIQHRNFQWSASFNISYNKNKILDVANDSLVQGWGSTSYYLNKGDDINALKAVKYAGVDPQTGQARFEKLIFDGSGAKTGVEYVNSVAEVGASVDNRQNQTLGSFQPKYYGGLTNTFSYKQFSLNILITYAMKYVMSDGLAQQNQGTSPTSFNQLKYRDNQIVWTTPGQTNATEPWIYYQANTSYYGSSKYIHDASNATLRSVRLSYDLTANALSKLKLSNCTVYFSGDNLYTVYSKSIVASNPEGPSVGEAQDFGQSSFRIGIPRKYNFGIQVTF